ncbi:MAG: hypothetical protein ACE5JO_12155 [Candidatus Binatia bacterium]
MTGAEVAGAGKHARDIARRAPLVEKQINYRKAYVNNNNESSIMCIQCGKIKITNISRYKNLHRPLKIKCGCESIFYIVLEIRNYYRKKVNLHGTYRNIFYNTDIGEMSVESLSRTGIGFKTNLKNNIKINDILKIEFVLDNGRKSTLCKMVTVRHTNGRFIGAEFCDKRDAVLGFYLLP